MTYFQPTRQTKYIAPSLEIIKIESEEVMAYSNLNDKDKDDPSKSREINTSYQMTWGNNALTE